MYEQTELHRAKITLALQKRKLERLNNETIAQRAKLHEQRELVKRLENEAKNEKA